MLDFADFTLQEHWEDNLMVSISRAWYNGSYTMAAKPIKSFELHCTMIQFLIKIDRLAQFYYVGQRCYIRWWHQSIQGHNINSCDDVSDLQSDLNWLESWVDNMGMAFNIKKCKVMHITRKRKPFESAYHLGGLPLACTKTEKDLGVVISDDLSWSKQVSKTCSRANGTRGFVRRNSKTIRNARIRRTMYLALVRPLLG